MGVGQDCEGHGISGRPIVLVGDLEREVVGTADQTRENQHWLAVRTIHYDLYSYGIVTKKVQCCREIL